MIRNIRLDKLKIKTKNYVQSNSTSIAAIKTNSKQSFQLLIQTNDDFDNYINNIYSRMMQEQNEHPNLIIPKKFGSFIKSKLFKQLLRKIYEYMMLIEQYSHQYKQIVVDNCLKGDSLMSYQASQLRDKCKQISYIYMGILLSYGDSKFIFKDQYFFQTMIYFLGQILKENFQQQIYPIIDEQLNRIFRTNTFNLIKRRYQEDQVVKKYPQLKDAKYSSTPHGDQRLINRLKAHRKFHFAVQISAQKQATIPKPLDIYQSASKSIHSRSPLIASFYPSSRDKLQHFNKQHKRESIIRPLCTTRSSSFYK